MSRARRTTCVVTAVVALVATASAACGGAQDVARGAPGARAARPADPSRLTLRQAIGQRFVFAYSGLTPPQALRKRIARGEAAGVILFARNVASLAQVRRTMRDLQRIPRPAGLDAPLLVLVDQEGGAVRRLPGPPDVGATATRTAAAAGRAGQAAGALLLGAGVNVDLAPVVDVARPGSVLEAEGRTYGRDVRTVVQLAGAFASGLRAGGVQPVLKHFPGFGAATVNTDQAPTRVDLPLATLRSVDEAPYRALRAPAVMVSTAVYPRVDPRPAAFSQRWVGGELRGRLGFGGVVLSDDLQAGSVHGFGAPAQLAYFAIGAGVDVPLFAHDYTTGARAAIGLERAVHDGALSRAQVEAGARRVLAWRATLAATGHP